MDELEQAAKRILLALGSPLYLVLMVPLAIVAALGLYLAAAGQGFWLLLRAIPSWLQDFRNPPGSRKPHFLQIPSAKDRMD